MRSPRAFLLLALVPLLLAAGTSQAASDDRFANTRIAATAVAGSVSMLTGDIFFNQRFSYVDLVSYQQMIEECLAHVRAGRAAGLDEAALVARGVPAQWADWTWGFITVERWVKILNGSLDAVHGG